MEFSSDESEMAKIFKSLKGLRSLWDPTLWVLSLSGAHLASCKKQEGRAPDRAYVLLQTTTDHPHTGPASFPPTTFPENEDIQNCFLGRNRTPSEQQGRKLMPLAVDSAPSAEPETPSSGFSISTAIRKTRYSYPTLSIRKERLSSPKAVAQVT